MRQDQKWGPQDHPSIFEDCVGEHLKCDVCEPMSNAEHVCKLYGIPSEEDAKRMCDIDHENGQDTHARIVIEELCEAISAFANDNPEQGEIELIQLGACVVLWLENIRERKARKEQNP